MVIRTKDADRRTELVALSQLLLDPYYRTIAGFKVLIQKEWYDVDEIDSEVFRVAFGHKYFDNYLLKKDYSNDLDNHFSPVKPLCFWSFWTLFGNALANFLIPLNLTKNS